MAAKWRKWLKLKRHPEGVQLGKFSYSLSMWECWCNGRGESLVDCGQRALKDPSKHLQLD